MITNAKQAVKKIERTLEKVNQKKENKYEFSESSALISKEILDAQARLENAKQKIEFIKLKQIISDKRQVNSSDEDSDDDSKKKCNQTKSRT
ncbi:hypothetical protein H375_5490 [Rickettsia prowazekii str. Breinl]|nr:hypothetical protein [Rickettsia prowazekii]AGJ02774.1 hypothetical protein H375_5490 [Rickettsia prowazekii str. Breinl]EOB09541.1 hypothetical protein H377_8450 [Rickettsia prowazekii str. Cairo 3]